MQPLRKHILLLILGIAIKFSLYAQQSMQFTQYLNYLNTINPAYSGYQEQWVGQMAIRSQWSGWEGAPFTGIVSVDGVLDKELKRNGIGLMIVGDKVGAQDAISMFGNYALRLQLDDDDHSRLSLGTAFGVTQYGLDGNKLRATDPGDQVLPDGKISTWRPDMRFGMLYTNQRWYLGLSVSDLFAGNNSDQDYKFNMSTTESLYRNINGQLIAGALLNLEEGLKLRPSVLVSDDFRSMTTLDVNMMLLFDQYLSIGGGFRTRNNLFNRSDVNVTPEKWRSIRSMSLMANMWVTDRFKLSYAYQYVINKMSVLSQGTHEIGLSYVFGQKSNHLYSYRPRYF